MGRTPRATVMSTPRAPASFPPGCCSCSTARRGPLPPPVQADGLMQEQCVSTSARECAACGGEDHWPMCNLYNITTNQEAIRRFIGIMEDRVGNLEPSLDLYPDRPAPVVRNVGNGVRELAKLTWGMPTPELFLKPGAPDTGVTNSARHGCHIGSDGSMSATVVSCRQPPSASTGNRRPQR